MDIKSIIDRYKSNMEEFLLNRPDLKESLYDYYSNEGKDQSFNIKCSDIQTANTIFEEYMDGMIKFFGDISNLENVPVERIELYGEKLSVAKENNLSFIKSLFNGTNVVPNGAKRGIDILNMVLDIYPTERILQLCDPFCEMEPCGLFDDDCKQMMLDAASNYYSLLYCYCTSMYELLHDSKTEEKFVIV